MKRHLIPLLGLIALGAMIYFSTLGKAKYHRTEMTYAIPAVTLINQDGQPVPLQTFLSPGKPVLLEFIFTSCTTLCPTQSVKFTNFQRRLAPDTEQVRLVSITIDPETDTPPLMKTYLKQFGAQPGWDFLTGDKETILRVMNAFGIQASDMITLDNSLLMRAVNGQWFKFDGELSGETFQTEFDRLPH